MRGKASLANRQHATALSPKSTPNSNTLLTTPRETAAAATAATHTHPSTPTQPRPAMEHDNSSNNNNQAPQQLVNEAVQLLMHQLEREQPCVATASITLGTLQDRLFSRNTTEPLQPTVAAYQQRFQELFVVPAAAKLAKCKTPQVHTPTHTHAQPPKPAASICATELAALKHSHTFGLIQCRTR